MKLLYHICPIYVLLHQWSKVERVVAQKSLGCLTQFVQLRNKAEENCIDI